MNGSKMNGNVYEVEKILGKRRKQFRIEYLIQWKGYSSNENTWTSEKNLNCPAKLAEFEATLQKKIKLNPALPMVTTCKKTKALTYRRDRIENTGESSESTSAIREDHFTVQKKHVAGKKQRKIEIVSGNEKNTQNSIPCYDKVDKAVESETGVAINPDKENMSEQSENGKTLKKRKYDHLDAGCLQLKDVERALEEKSILPVLSVEGDKKSELYKVVQRLVRVSSGLIIPHFFLCSICKSVLNINTSTHYPALGRHYSKCVKTARVQPISEFYQELLKQMVEESMIIAREYGLVNLHEAFIEKVRSIAKRKYDSNGSSNIEDA